MVHARSRQGTSCQQCVNVNKMGLCHVRGGWRCEMLSVSDSHAAIFVAIHTSQEVLLAVVATEILPELPHTLRRDGGAYLSSARVCCCNRCSHAVAWQGVAMLTSCCSPAYQQLANEDADAEAKDDAPKVDLRGALYTFRVILPFFWPADWGLRMRLISSMVLIILSKVVNLFVPPAFSAAVNQLRSEMTIPVLAISLYGGLRMVNALVTEIQATIFLQVTQHATRSLSVKAFAHLHALSLNWHLKRKTGAVLRTINRGTTSIATLIRLVLFVLAPTLLELVMVVFR